MNRNRLGVKATALACLLASMALVGARQARAVEPLAVAVLDFDTSGAKGLSDGGGVMLAALLSVKLSDVDGIHLVERTMLRQAMEEQALGLSGMVDAQTAAHVSRLVGAQVLVTGRAFTISKKLVVTARLIGTETGHVQAVAAEGRAGGEIVDAMGGLAEEISRALLQRRQEFVAAAQETPDLVAELVHALSGMTLPRVAVRVQETVLDVEARDSVAESELTSLLLAVNLEVMQAADADLPAGLEEYFSAPHAAADALGDVDVVIFGKAVGEFGLRTGDLVSAKGQVKFTAVDANTKRVLAASDTEQKGIDVVPQGAAIQAITEATREIARELVPELVRAWNRTH